MNVSNYKDRKWYLLSLYGSGGSFSRSGVRISQSLSTQGSSNRQKSIFSSLHYAAMLHFAVQQSTVT